MDAQIAALQGQLSRSGFEHVNWSSPDEVADVYAQIAAERQPDPPGFWTDPIVRDAFAIAGISPADVIPQHRLVLQEAAMQALQAERARLQQCDYREPVRPQDVGTDRDFRVHLQSSSKSGSTSAAGSEHLDDSEGSSAGSSQSSAGTGSSDGCGSERAGSAGDADPHERTAVAAQAEQLQQAHAGQLEPEGADVEQDAMVAAVQALAIGTTS